MGSRQRPRERERDFFPPAPYIIISLRAFLLRALRVYEPRVAQWEKSAVKLPSACAEKAREVIENAPGREVGGYRFDGSAQGFCFRVCLRRKRGLFRWA